MRNFKKRLILVIMSFIMTFSQVATVFAESTDGAESSDSGGETANDRVMNNINLAKGKQASDIDVNQIGTDELRLIGVFLSNFYEPWSTELIDAESEKDIKKQQQQALVDSCNFNKTMAKTLVEKVWEASKDSAKPLYIGKQAGGKGDVEDIHIQTQKGGDTIYYGDCPDNKDSIFNEDGKVPATYFSFLDIFAGVPNGTDNPIQLESTLSGVELSNINVGDNLVLYWENEGTKTPVFDTSIGSFTNEGSDSGEYDVDVTGKEGYDENTLQVHMKFTPSTIMYGLICDSLNYKNGIGSALVDCKTETFNKMNDEQQEQSLVLNSRLYIDCFGNILVNTGISKYVLFPACANPYTWATKKDLSDVGKKVPCVNLFCLGEAEQGHITGELIEDKNASKKTDTSKKTDASSKSKKKTSTTKSSVVASKSVREKILVGSGTDSKTSETTESKKVDIANSSLKYTFYFYNGGGSLFNLKNWRTNREDSNTSLDDSWWFASKGNFEELYNKMAPYCKQDHCPANALNFSNWSEYYRSCKYKLDEDDTSYNMYLKKTSLIADFIQIDNLNEFKESEDDYSVFKTYDGGIFAVNGEGECEPLKNSGGTDFNNCVEPGRLNIPSGSSAKAYLTGIYCSYVLAFFNDGDKDKYKVGYYFAGASQYPEISDVEIDWATILADEDDMANEVLSMVYYFLHPDVGIAYVATWFKNKVAGILTEWHEDMVGGSDASNTTGGTKYLGFSGYVTIPTLHDMSWTDKILDNYNNIIVYLIIIMFIILVAYCIVGQMTIQRVIFGVVIFGVLAFFPPLCINASVNLLNTTCDRIYGDKFTYWAIVQHATYLDDLDKAMDLAEQSGSKDSYLKFVFTQQDGIASKDYTRVKLKWLAPKKTNVTADVDKELGDATNDSMLGVMLNGLIQEELSGEEYQESSDALYLYRDYADIFQYSSTAYDVSGYDSSIMDVNDVDMPVDLKYSSGKKMYRLYNNDDETLDYTNHYWMKHGFVTNMVNEETNKLEQFSNKSYNYLLDSEVFPEILENNEDLTSEKVMKEDLDIVNDLDSVSFGLANESFNVTLADVKGGFENLTSDINQMRDTDLGKFYFNLYSESPYYFFNWNILDQESSLEFADLVNTSQYGQKLMNMYTDSNQRYFYNYSEDALDGFGELRDFSNMHGLFYYVIPYLKACNQGVLKWSSLYGTYLYDDVRVEYDSEGKAVIPDLDATTSSGRKRYDEEYIYKWWHNYNVERLFNTYSPWVDLMYACDYADPELIRVHGEKFMVNDPLDPTSYYTTNKQGKIKEGRMMVFSRSEMRYYGLKENDLTQVEKKIIDTQDKVYEDLLQLMDYYQLGDSIDMNKVLTTSAGMITTFAFNQEFSQTSYFGESYTLYPQSYELKAFTYDAYLRLIMAESTGESLLDTTNSTSKNDNTGVESAEHRSYYQRIIENSSITTGIGFIILDLLAVYVIPAFKMFFLLAIFFMSIAMILASAIKLEINMANTIWRALIMPLVKFLGVSVGLAWVVSLFMSDGNTAVTNRETFTISMGDPVMVILVMIVLNAVATVLYYKICKQLLHQILDFSKAIASSISGAVGGVAGKIFGGVLQGKTVSGSDTVAHGTAMSRGRLNRPSVHGHGGLGRAIGGAIGGGLVARQIAKAVKPSRGTESKEPKANKYDRRAERYTNKAIKAEEKATASKQERMKNRYDTAIKNEERKVEANKQVHRDQIEMLKKQREIIHEHSNNSFAPVKAVDWAKDKKLAAQIKAHQVASGASGVVGGTKKFANKTVYKVKSGANSASRYVRNNSVGRVLHVDDESARRRAHARSELNLSRAEHMNFKRNYYNSPKHKGENK